MRKTRHGQCNMARMQQAVALIGEPDPALRDLMRRALESADYAVFASASAAQLDAALRTRRVTQTPRALLVVSKAMFEACSGVVVAFTRWRTALGRPAPHVLLICEFGTLRNSSRPDLGECLSAGMLEKPFDLTLLRRIALRCRMSSRAPRLSP
jgi:hypothetical protein